MSRDPEDTLYEALGALCEHLVQGTAYHVDRLTLLACPPAQWLVVRDIIDPRTAIAAQLEAIERGHITLYAHHAKTPDNRWSLVSFYADGIDAIVATALLLNEAHRNELRH
ncbi:MAG: hypothetical protein VX589_20565 [Myxococcota bacterium]|nr:hypothetical protein [Myxococcota bacterium]